MKKETAKKLNKITAILFGFVGAVFALLLIIAMTSENSNEMSPEEKALREKVSIGDAIVQVEKYGKTIYPYGFDVKTPLTYKGVKDENTWKMQGKANVKNQYNAEFEIIFESEVTAIDNGSKVTYFYIYD